MVNPYCCELCAAIERMQTTIDQMQTREELYGLLDYDPKADSWPG